MGRATGAAPVWLTVLFAVAAPVIAGAQSPELQSDTDVATAGFYQLRWFGEGAVELQEAGDQDFTSAHTIYRGRDKARVMSGKSDGIFYYRVQREDDGALSNVVKVTVRHHSLARAFAFFSLGGIVFLSTLLLIVTGSRRRGDTG